MAEQYALRIPAKLEGMDLVLAFVSLLLDTNGCSTKARTQLRMAVEEIYVNQNFQDVLQNTGLAWIGGLLLIRTRW